MAVLAAAQLLDELMGRNRNIAPDQKGREINWEDPELCKYFMVKFCPHDLFVNTRADLGACPKLHDEEAKKLFQKAKSIRKIHYQEEFLRFCNSMVNEVERKIIKGKQRLALSGKTDIMSVTPAQTLKNQEQINILNERINNLELEAEQAGIDGNVEQAQGLMRLCDQLKDERDALRKQIENGHWSATAELAAAQEKQMEVCEVCGAFLIVGDAQQRIDDHLQGKQHGGFARLKAAIGEIANEIQTLKDERERNRGGGLGSDDRDGRSRDRSRGRDRDREKRRERRDRSSSSRSRSELRDKDRRDRDKDRDKEKREKERLERREKEREREREREREKDRERDRDRERSRERDRERRHRSDRESGGRESRSRHHSHRH